MTQSSKAGWMVKASHQTTHPNEERACLGWCVAAILAAMLLCWKLQRAMHVRKEVERTNRGSHAAVFIYELRTFHVKVPPASIEAPVVGQAIHYRKRHIPPHGTCCDMVDGVVGELVAGLAAPAPFCVHLILVKPKPYICRISSLSR